MKALFPAALALSVVLAGCVATHGPVVERKPYQPNARQIEQVKATVGRDLRDPVSAQYKNIQAGRIGYQNAAERIIVCGAVNAKNAYGGYVGFVTFGGEIGVDGAFFLIGVDRGQPGFYDANCRLNYGMTTL